MVDVKKWTFYDAEDDTTWTFPVNPNDGGSPDFTKTFTFQSTAAPDGKALIFEGRPEVQKLEFSGVILEREQHDKFIEWWGKRRQVKVTDDLERTFWIYIQTYSPKRKRAYLHPWKHDYSISAVIVDWEMPP